MNREQELRRLIEILNNCPFDCGSLMADFLLANGVIVPSVKVGDKVWRRGGYSFRVVEIDIYQNYTIFRCGNDGTDDYMAFDISDIGKTVFLTQEEAEKALKENTRAGDNNA